MTVSQSVCAALVFLRQSRESGCLVCFCGGDNWERLKSLRLELLQNQMQSLNGDTIHCDMKQPFYEHTKQNGVLAFLQFYENASIKMAACP